jgi:hypothetical protein
VGFKTHHRHRLRKLLLEFDFHRRVGPDGKQQKKNLKVHAGFKDTPISERGFGKTTK